MDSRFDQNQSELSVLVLSVSFQVLSDRDSLLNQEVQVFWDFWSQTVGLQNSHDLVTGDDTGLSNTVCISQQDTNLRWGQTLSGVLGNLLNDSVGGQLEPSWSISRVWKSGRRDTFTLLKWKLLVKMNLKKFFSYILRSSHSFPLGDYLLMKSTSKCSFFISSKRFQMLLNRGKVS